MKYRIRPRIGLAMLLVALGCSSTVKHPTRHVLVKAWYSTGGAAPSVTELTVTDNGYLNLMTPGWHTHTLRVGEDELERLRLLLGLPEFRAALARATESRASAPRGEAQVLLTVGTQQYRFPIGAAPPRVRTLLEALDDLFSRRFGSRYGLRLPT